MAGGRTRSSAARDADRGEKRPMKEEGDEDLAVVSDHIRSLEAEVATLRCRWELASVLNFLTVFEPVIGKVLKMSAEEIEMGLITPNSSLAQLHIELLKGVPPVSKALNGSEAWVTVLCKKLAMWWPWVAEGELPVKAVKGGQEISKYGELDPTTRLLILKALCEIRAEQDDIVSYINNSMKEGTQMSCFRKDKIGGGRNGTSYWHDGSGISGYRLYKEVITFEPKKKVKGKGNSISSLPTINFQWQMIAADLMEFRKVTDQLLSSKITSEVAAGKTIEADCIPVLEKLQKKKERVQKKKQRQEVLLNGFRSSYSTGLTRSCRNRAPVSYTFDEYDRAIDEAIHISKKRKPNEEQKQEGKQGECGKLEDIASSRSSDTDNTSEDSDDREDSQDNDSEYKIVSNNNNDNEAEIDQNHGTLDSQKQVGYNDIKFIRESGNAGAKQILRQRPTLNSAIDSMVVPDSDDEN